MSLPEHFISCDWGTTNFRLRLVETSTLKVLAEQKSDHGIKTIHTKFLAQKKKQRQQFYFDFLATQIRRLPRAHQNKIVVMSGMASSNMGVMELSYSEFPFDGSGNSLVYRSISIKDGPKILLVSGVKSGDGMMRGEETQAIGLAQQLISYKKGILILPGTHSKHIDYQNGAFTALKNFMTGELFELLSNHSILGNSITHSHWGLSGEEAFKEGLNISLNNSLNSSLLKLRARHLFGQAKPEDNYHFLSGLLIGDELSYLKNYDEMILLAAPASISKLYQLGLYAMTKHEQIVVFDDKVLDNALLVGQRKMLKLYEI